MKCPRLALLAAVLFGIPFLPACASIMQGTTQQVGIGSSPTGARVLVNGQALGTTPVNLDLARKEKHLVRIELDGYEPYELAMTRSVSGWVVGNILFGGLIGLAVDAMSGGMYKLSPEQINATMPEARVGSGDSDRLFVAVVLSVDPAWEKIGEMERE